MIDINLITTDNMKIVAYKYDGDGDYDLVIQKSNGYHYSCLVHNIHGLKDILDTEAVRLSEDIDIKVYKSALDAEHERKLQYND